MAVIGFSSAGVFSSAIDVATDLTDNQNTILSAINSMRAGSGTDYTAALTKAKQILGVRNSRPKYVVFISDGAPGPYGNSIGNVNWDGSEQVAQLKNAGVTIYTIGIALDGNNNQAAREYLKAWQPVPAILEISRMPI